MVVPYRTIPNDPYSCLVVFVDTLSSDEHDSLMRVTESAAGQSADELAEVMDRTYLSDGRNMLLGFYKTGKLQKIATSDVEMIPNATSAVGLDELNRIIAEQRGVSLEDLSIKSGTEQKTPKALEENVVPKTTTETVLSTAVDEPLTDADLARKYRSDADRLSKEAANLRRMAEELVPTKKPATVLKKPSEKKQVSA